MAETVETDAYLQVRPRNRWVPSHKRGTAEEIEGAAVVRVTQNRPEKPEPGTLTVKVRLRIPKRAFLPLAPEAVIDIPADLTDPTEGQ
ncbi:hypothetical protein [Curtobacterium sp. MEB011]|uniref:hypothetical protein n=1 Tax=Curtobacterium sp. MEB011 TaxID=3040285 RepID=UPI00254E4AD2|nr:hypothetical protein [Curtobacterium sp. MEB011]